MKYKAQTHKPVLLEVTFYSPENAVLGIKGYQKGKSNTVFVDRKYGSVEKPIKGKATVKFPFPTRLTAMKVGFQVVNLLNPKKKVTIVKVKHSTFAHPQLAVAETTKDFIKFALEFAQKSGTINTGKWESDCGKFQISFLDVIRDYTTGQKVDTPARINHQTGLIEICKKDFDKMTVINRFYILMHEFAHFANNTQDEIECDMLAAKTCMEMGFSAIECLYSVSKLFMYNTSLEQSLKAEQERRVKMVKDFIGKYAVI